ncbi:MAG: hypothetical protein R3C53_09605 [Pirellulaceae bacterium]
MAELEYKAARASVIRLILLVAAVLQLVRIAQVQSSTGEVPFLSANDRSRWCTVAALTINGSYEIDEVVEIRDPQTRRRTWYTIDMVQHRGMDGKQHFYSSKPPLLPTLYAGVYYTLRAITGSSLMNDPFFVARCMLVLVNWLPLVATWCLLARWLTEKTDDWAATVAITFIGFGTFLSTFANTLNNHLPAALAVGISLWCIDRIALQKDRAWRWFVLCGLTTSFGAANELPALSWVAAAGALLLLIDAQRTLLGYVPALVPVALGFFVTNYIAHGEWIPAYAHRNLGEQLLSVEVKDAQNLAALEPQVMVEALNAQEFGVSNQLAIRPARRPGVWEAWDEVTQQRFGLQPIEGQSRVGVFRWGDWYDYPGSYWLSDRKQGVDRGEADRSVYVFHCLVGHHGIFSLTPFWLLSVLGCVCVWRSRATWNIFRDRPTLIAAAILATSLVAVAFYLARPLEDRNYGGVASGFRWSFWLTIPWIWLAIHALRATKAAWQRRMVEICLAVSVFSAFYAWANPWTSPWLMQYWEYLGWL